MPRSTIDATDKHVGNRVRMRRLMLEITLEDLAKAVGVSWQQMRKYEVGVNRISASRLQHIAQIIKVPVPFFFEEVTDSIKEVPAQVNDYRQFMATRDGVELARAFPRIKNQKVRRAIVDLVEQIVPE